MSAVKRTARQERAEATRGRMLDAAYELFCERGYRATTMDAIAERAGVAVQTMYFTFRTKDALLQQVHHRMVLGDDPTPPDRQAWRLAAQAEADPRRAVAMIVDGVSAILARAAAMVPVFHSVTAEPAGEFYRHTEDLRRRGYALLADDLVHKAPMAAGATAGQISDVLFVLLGPEVYRSFVIDLGWPHERWAAWTTDTLVREIFGPPGA